MRTRAVSGLRWRPSGIAGAAMLIPSIPRRNISASRRAWQIDDLAAQNKTEEAQNVKRLSCGLYYRHRL